MAACLLEDWLHQFWTLQNLCKSTRHSFPPARTNRIWNALHSWSVGIDQQSRNTPLINPPKTMAVIHRVSWINAVAINPPTDMAMITSSGTKTLSRSGRIQSFRRA